MALTHQAVLRLGTFIVGIALARILAPQDFGVYAIALVVLTLMRAVNDVGTGVALVQWPDDPRSFAPSALTVTMVLSLGIYMAIYASAPVIAAATGSPAVTSVLRVLGICLIIDAIAVVPGAMLAREFLQGRRFIGDMLAFLAGNAVSVLAAINGSGPMAFALGSLVGSAIAAVSYTILSPLRVLPGWSGAVVQRLIVYGLPLAGSTLLGLAAVNLDNLVVGAVTTQAALGLYAMAFNQSSWPINIFAEATRRVALAGFSRMAEDPAALDKSFATGLGLLVALTVPVATLLMAYAEPLLMVLYGPQWLGAAQTLTLLAGLGILRVGVSVVDDLLMATARAKQLMIRQAIWVAALIPATFVGTQMGGIEGAAVSQLAVATLVLTPLAARQAKRVGVSLGQAALQLARPLAGGILIMLSSIAVRIMVGDDLLQLLVGGVVALGVYTPVIWPMRRLLPGRGAVSRR